MRFFSRSYQIYDTCNPYRTTMSVVAAGCPHDLSNSTSTPLYNVVSCDLWRSWQPFYHHQRYHLIGWRAFTEQPPSRHDAIFNGSTAPVATKVVFSDRVQWTCSRSIPLCGYTYIGYVYGLPPTFMSRRYMGTTWIYRTHNIILHFTFFLVFWLLNVFFLYSVRVTFVDRHAFAGKRWILNQYPLKCSSFVARL